MRLQRLTTTFFVPLLTTGLLALGACGGGGGGGGSSGAGEEPVVYTVPPAPPPSEPPSDPPPTTTPPPATPPPVDPPPTEPPPTEPPPTDPPPTAPPPAAPAVPLLPVVEPIGGCEDVHGLAVDPQSDTLYAVRAARNEVISLTLGTTQWQAVGSFEAGAVRALTFDAANDTLLAVADGDAGADDELLALDPADGSVVTRGTITGYREIEALAFHGEGAERKLYAVDSASDVLLRIHPASGLPTLVGSLGVLGNEVHALASHTPTDTLLGVDAGRGDLLVIDPATGAARQRLTLAVGPLRGLGYAPGPQVFFGVGVDDKLHRVDAEGTWIEWDHIKGLAYDAAGEVLYGVDTQFGLIVRIDPESRWRQPLAQVQDAGLEGLAFDPTTGTLHVLSRTTGALFTVQPSSGDVQPAGTVMQGPAPWLGLASLTFAAGKLYAIDTGSSNVLEITPAGAAATVFTSLTGVTGLHGLTYDPAEDRLLASATGTHTVLSIPRVLGAPADVLAPAPLDSIGGLAWLPATTKLVASDLEARDLVTLYERVTTSLGFDAVHALTRTRDPGMLRGFDRATQQWLDIEAAAGRAEVRADGTGLQIEGLAFDEDTATSYALDAAGGTLYALAEDGTLTRRGAVGALAGVDVKALAFDPSNAPGQLFGYDNTARKLLSIDVATGVPTVIGGAVDGPSSVEALTWAGTGGELLAIDRSTRTLMIVDQATGLFDSGVEIVPTDVRSMTLIVATDELLVVDATLDRLLLLDRFTGEELEPFVEIGTHRGVTEAPALLLWPRGHTLAANARSLAIQIAPSYENDAFLVIRRGEKVLHRARFEPELMVSLAPIPAAVQKVLRTGDQVMWGLEFGDKRKPITARFTVVAEDANAVDLKRLLANPVLRKQKPHVVATRVARVLRRHGQHGAAAVHAAEAAKLSPRYVPAQRELRRALRALLGEDAQGWTGTALAKLLQSKHGPWKLVGLPAPRAAANSK